MKIFVKDINHPRFGQIGKLIDSESLQYLFLEFPDSKQSEIFQLEQCEEAKFYNNPINAFRNAIERYFWQQRKDNKDNADWWKK